MAHKLPISRQSNFEKFESQSHNPQIRSSSQINHGPQSSNQKEPIKLSENPNFLHTTQTFDPSKFSRCTESSTRKIPYKNSKRSQSSDASLRSISENEKIFARKEQRGEENSDKNEKKDVTQQLRFE